MIGKIINLTASLQSYITDIGNSAWVAGLKWLGFFLALLFGALSILAVVKLEIFGKWFKTAKNFLLMAPSSPKKQLNESWQKIVSRLSENSEANLRLALIEADNLFDDLLKRMGLQGESMADRLKYVDSSQVPNIDEIWRAHKLRNNIVHNPEFPVTRNEIEFSVKSYEKALKALGFVD